MTAGWRTAVHVHATARELRACSRSSMDPLWAAQCLGMHRTHCGAQSHARAHTKHARTL